MDGAHVLNAARRYLEVENGDLAGVDGDPLAVMDCEVVRVTTVVADDDPHLPGRFDLDAARMEFVVLRGDRDAPDGDASSGVGGNIRGGDAGCRSGVVGCVAASGDDENRKQQRGDEGSNAK